MRTILFAVLLFAASAIGQQGVQQHQLTTNKFTVSTGLTNVVTATNVNGVKLYDLRMDLDPGSGIVFVTNGTKITLSAAGTGLGDVVGPTGATNTAVPIFDGVSGKLITTSSRGYIINGGTFNAYNCLSFGDYVSYRNLSGTMNVYNSIAQSWSSDGFSGTIGGDYNVSEGADDPPGSNPADQTVNVVFVSESAPYDFHLDASDASGVKDATSDQSGGLFADDIDYVTRSGSWDIGADEYVAAATSAGQIIIIRQQ